MNEIEKLELKEEMRFEELVGLKDMLAHFKGSDPLVIQLKEPDGKITRILSDSHFWVNADNELIHAVNNNFAGKVDISVKSLDE